MLALAALLCPGLAPAQTPAAPAPAPTPDEHRLTPEQIEAVLAEAAARRAAEAKRAPMEVAPDQHAEDQPGPQVQGEVGLSIGTGGYREAYGTAIYPLEGGGVAAISLDFIDLGRRHYPR